MRISFQVPNEAAISPFLEKSRQCPFNYSLVGYTKTGLRPRGYNLDSNRFLLGKGRACFEQAKRGIQDWQMFQLGWVRLLPDTTPIEVGEVVSVNFRLLGLWWSNSCEIVYTIDEPNNYGFAYGTKSHVESGEEIFRVWIDEEEQVFYEIQAFSRPGIWLTWLAYPITRVYQRKFVRESQQAMLNFLSHEIL